jgi:hypothetical protein
LIFISLILLNPEKKIYKPLKIKMEIRIDNRIICKLKLIALFLAITTPVKAQDFWQGTLSVPGAFKSNGAFINDVISTDDGLFITGNFGAIDGVRANSVAFWDGLNWLPLGSGLTNADGSVAKGNDLYIDGNHLYVVGEFEMAGDSLASNIARWNLDTQVWETFSGVFNNEINTVLTVGSNVYVGGDFESIDGAPFLHIALWDGESWNSFQGGVNGNVNVLKRNNSQLYVGGLFSIAGATAVNNLAIWTGTQWTDFNGGSDGEVFDIEFFGDSTLVGGDFNELDGNVIPYLGILHDGSWISYDLQPNSTVMDIHVWDNQIAISGDFDQIGILQTSGFAIRNGSWSVPNDQLSLFGRLNTAAFYDGQWVIAGTFNGSDSEILNDIAVVNADNNISKFGLQDSFLGPNGEVRVIKAADTGYYIGGTFNGVGSELINKFAYWNGTNWESYGESPNSTVHDILVDGDMVYIAGSFTLIGDLSANRVAVLNTNTGQWSAMGDGANNTVYKLLKIGNSIYAGGVFTEVEGQIVNRVAVWNGSSWSALDAGTDGVIYDMLEYNGKLYVGGNYTSASGVAANNIAAWNGASWEALGTGLDDAVFSLAKTDSSIFMGGDFQNTPGGSASHIAEWSSGSNQWYEVGLGLDDRVRSLLIYNDTLYAAGRFEAEIPNPGVLGGGTMTLNGIAFWSGDKQWQALGSGFSGFSSTAIQVYDVEMINNNLAAGGFFDVADESFSPGLAFRQSANVITSNQPEESPDLVQNFKLHQNYPNPFNPSTNIGFELGQSGFVSLTVYNLLGQEVSTIVNQRLAAGNYEYSFNAENLSTGIYLYRLNTQQGSLTRKMLLIK